MLAGYRPQIYLLTGEERGGIGADHLAYHTDYAPPDSLHVLLELDRQGGNDFVSYDCDSPKLDKWVRKFGFEKATGSFSDISILAPLWGIAAANLSVGYYGQHTRSEMLIVPQLVHTIARVGKMIDHPPKKPLEYIECKRWSSRVSGYGSLHSDKVSSWPASDYRTTLDEPIKPLGDDEPLKLGIDSERCSSCNKRVHDYLALDGAGWCEDCVWDFQLVREYEARTARDKGDN